MNILIYTEESRLGTAEIPPFIVGDSTTWTLMFQNAAGEFYSPSAVTMKLGHINGLADGTYTNAFKWVDRCRNEHTASIVVTAGVPAVTWDTQPVGGMVGASGVYIVRGQIPDGRITGVVPNDLTIELGKNDLAPKTPSRFTFSDNAGGAGAYGNLHWELKKYILRINITNGGTGYTTAPTVVFTGGGGDHAAATATISDCGTVVAIAITDNGCSYTSGPTISLTGGGGSGAEAFCEWIDSDGSAGITSVEVKAGGTGYSSAPTVAVTDSAGVGTGAVVEATGWDGVSKIVITAQGTGYTSNPTVVGFSGGGGTGATAIISGFGIIGDATFTGTPGSASISDADEKETIAYNFTFSGGGGTGATGVATFIRQSSFINHGGLYVVIGPVSRYVYALSSVRISNAGSGYTGNPTASVLGYTVTGKAKFIATITNLGTGYTSAPTIAISGGGGSGMTATATVGVVTGFRVTNPGQDYGTPVVVVTGGSTQATAVANAGGRRRYGVKFAEILSPGNGYSSTPEVLGNIQTVSGAVAIDYSQASRFIKTIQAGIEQSELPYKRAESGADIMGAVRLSGFSDGRYSSGGRLQYDHSALLVLPRAIASATLTAGTNDDGDPIWSGTVDPINAHVTARLATRRFTTLDLQIFGDGRMLFQGALAILAKIN